MSEKKKDLGDYSNIVFKLLLLSAVTIIAFAIATSIFARNVRNKSERGLVQSVRNASLEVASEYGLKLDKAKASIHTAAGFFAHEGIDLDSVELIKVLGTIKNNTGAEDVYVSNEDHDLVYQDGHTGNSKDFEWDSEVYAGNEVMDVYFVNITSVGPAKMVVSCPVVSDGTVIGSVTALIPPGVFSEATVHGRMEWNTGYMLAGADGEVYFVSTITSFKPGNMLFDGSSIKLKGKASFDSILTDMAKARNGSFNCTVGSRDYYVRYDPVSGGKWYLFSLFVEKYRDAQIDSAASVNEQQGIVMVVIFILFILLASRLLLDELQSDSRSMSKLQNDAEKDLLTGVYNKLSTEKRIRSYMQKEGACGLFYIVDLDNFKKINDTYGHAFGDEVLRTVGKRLNTEFRATDIVGRLGGDEFCVFLKDLSNEEEKKTQIDRMSTIFKDIYAGEHVKYNPTASIGGAEFPKHGKTFEEIYRAADRALYDVKENGKNGIKIYEKKE